MALFFFGPIDLNPPAGSLCSLIQHRISFAVAVLPFGDLAFNQLPHGLAVLRERRKRIEQKIDNLPAHAAHGLARTLGFLPELADIHPEARQRFGRRILCVGKAFDRFSDDLQRVARCRVRLG
ncbi:hypothetical protein GC207_03590 [bacterium]|nr:hypothetical protein [bacterium]